MPAIVNPVKNRKSPQLGPAAAMAATRPDFDTLAETMGLCGSRRIPLYTSRLCLPGSPDGPCLAGPMIGAPCAVMILETLVAWGARRVIFLGWCGAVSPEVQIGDVILPVAALADEGTSIHYGAKKPRIRRPPGDLARKMAQRLDEQDIRWHGGPVWTTDAIYRETEEAVRRHQGAGILAVEMETSALFAAAAFRRVELVSLLVVSDELSSLTWQPGFKDGRFIEARRIACEVAAAVLVP